MKIELAFKPNFIVNFSRLLPFKLYLIAKISLLTSDFYRIVYCLFTIWNCVLYERWFGVLSV